MSSKIAEAESHILAAQKCLKTSLLKWKPDIDGAIDEYQKAATCYRNARDIEKAASTYETVADLHKRQNAIFHAAKSLEQAALLYKELKRWDRICPLFMQAAQFFRENGSVDTATVSLERGAKILELNCPQDAARLYDLATDTAEIEEKIKQAADNSNSCARMLIRIKDYDGAHEHLERRISLLRREEASNDVMALMSKTAACILLVQLSRGDSVAARMALEKIGVVLQSSDDAGPVTRLLSAYEAGDQEGAKAALSTPTFKYLDNDFVKLGRDLKIPGATESTSEVAGGAEAEKGDVPDDLLL